MNFNRKIIVIASILFLLQGCANNKTEPQIIFIFDSSKFVVDQFEICESDYGFEISIESSLQKKVANKKIKTVFLNKGAEKIEIKAFNILYSPPQNFPHKAPTKPNGALAFFRDGDNLIIDVLSDKKDELINLVGKDKVFDCASH